MARLLLILVLCSIFVIVSLLSVENRLWQQLQLHGSDESWEWLQLPSANHVAVTTIDPPLSLVAQPTGNSNNNSRIKNTTNATTTLTNKGNDLSESRVDGSTYISNRLQTLKDTVRTFPREPFLPPSSLADSNRAVFYNVYIPPENQARVFRLIINNQMRSVFESRWQNATVYYNLIGSDDERSDRPICRPGQSCRKLRHLPIGDEVDTLQDMHDYCVERPDHAVVYLHDKGSFHHTPSNSRVRRLATRAALTDECYDHVVDENDHHDNDNANAKCNVCSVNFNFVHFHHTSGNMFSAACSYIRTLIPPKQFEIKRLEMLKSLQETLAAAAPPPPAAAEQVNTFDCFRECILEKGTQRQQDRHTEVEYHKYLAIGRYSYETWVYSSPLAKPCFVLRQPFSELENGWEPWEPNLTVAHDFHIPHLFSVDKLDYYQGPGKLFEYRYLYDKVPGNESWFWHAWSRYLRQLPKKDCEC